jgi:hypothetical protein
MNDVKAISAYAPHVDAMFLDRKSAALLNEEPLKSELPVRARIFSLQTADEFLEYLKEQAQRLQISGRAQGSSMAVGKSVSLSFSPVSLRDKELLLTVCGERPASDCS